jgi:hypothetical protein
MEATTIKLTGTVRKVIDRSAIEEPEQAQIALAGAGYLYDELRIPNILGWEEGKAVELTIKPLQNQ